MNQPSWNEFCIPMRFPFVLFFWFYEINTFFEFFGLEILKIKKDSLKFKF